MLFISNKGTENKVPKRKGRYILTSQHLDFVTEDYRNTDMWLFCDDDSVIVEIASDFWRVLSETNIWFLPDFYPKESRIDSISLKWNDGGLNIIEGIPKESIFEAWLERVEVKSLNITDVSVHMTTSTGQAPLLISPKIARLMSKVQNGVSFTL